MNRKICLAMLIGTSLALFAGMTVLAVERSSQSAVGTWQLDVTKSSNGKMPAATFEQLVITIDDGNTYKWSLVGTEGHGVTFSKSYDGPIDGQDHPMTSSESGSLIAYTKAPSGILRWVAKDKDGAVIETASRWLAPDGKIMTIKGTANFSGGAAFISVFDKVK
jgi:plastocyanin